MQKDIFICSVLIRYCVQAAINGVQKYDGNEILFHFQKDYFHQLAKAGDLKMVPEVIFKIYDDCADLRITQADDFRQFVYTIVDDKTFTRSKLDENNNTET